jgi:hypothetical protein
MHNGNGLIRQEHRNQREPARPRRGIAGINWANQIESAGQKAAKLIPELHRGSTGSLTNSKIIHPQSEIGYAQIILAGESLPILVESTIRPALSRIATFAGSSRKPRRAATNGVVLDGARSLILLFRVAGI